MIQYFYCDCGRNKKPDDLMCSICHADPSVRKKEHSVFAVMSPAATEVLRCLFFHGPTYDGNIPSKEGRRELYELALVDCSHNGWTWLNRKGIIHAIAIGMSPAATEVLRCLFFHGPTCDGDIPSKEGRRELSELALVDCSHNGWTWLSRKGVIHAIAIGLDDAKGKWQRDRKNESRDYTP